MQILLQYKFHFELEERMQINFIRDFIFSLSKDKHQRLWIITKTLKRFQTEKCKHKHSGRKRDSGGFLCKKAFSLSAPKALCKRSA